jgi:hypothetical protein
MIWVGHLERMGEIWEAYTNFSESLKERNHLEDPGINRVIL